MGKILSSIIKFKGEILELTGEKEAQRIRLQKFKKAYKRICNIYVYEYIKSACPQLELDVLFSFYSI